MWRRSADCFNPESYLQCNPDPGQVQASPYPVPDFSVAFPPLYDGHPAPPDSSLGPRRGVYLPFTLLLSPASARSYRLVYPHLLVASDSTNQAFIWHIPTSTLVETIDITAPPNLGMSHLPSRITYVDLSRSLIIVCWAFALVMYRRGTAEGDMTVLLDLQSMIAHPDRMSFRGIACDTFMGNVISYYKAPDTSFVHPVPGPPGTHPAVKLEHIPRSKFPTVSSKGLPLRFLPSLHID